MELLPPSTRPETWPVDLAPDATNIATGIVRTEPARLAVVGKMTGQPACNLIPLFADPGLIHINELLEKARFNPPTPSGAEPN
jgi:hypothetical protein